MNEFVAWWERNIEDCGCLDDCEDMAKRAFRAGMLAAAETDKELLVHIYNSGYMAGHNDTVESIFTCIHESDMSSYHGDVVADLVNAKLKELLP